MVGKGCDRLLEACLIFGSGAYYYEKNGLGRSISQDEALEILNKGFEAGLVLQPVGGIQVAVVTGENDDGVLFQTTGA